MLNKLGLGIPSGGKKEGKKIVRIMFPCINFLFQSKSLLYPHPSEPSSSSPPRWCRTLMLVLRTLHVWHHFFYESRQVLATAYIFGSLRYQISCLWELWMIQIFPTVLRSVLSTNISRTRNGFYWISLACVFFDQPLFTSHHAPAFPSGHHNLATILQMQVSASNPASIEWSKQQVGSATFANLYLKILTHFSLFLTMAQQGQGWYALKLEFIVLA